MESKFGVSRIVSLYLQNHSTSKTTLRQNCFKMFSNMIKTYGNLFLVLLLLNLGILEMEHKCTTLLSTDLAWIFHYFCTRLFLLFWPVKKQSRLILKNFQIIYLIYYTLLQLSSKLHLILAKLNSTKISKN